MIELQRDRARDDIVTRGDLWFHLTPDYEFLWLPRDEKVPERERQRVQSKSSYRGLFGIRAGSI
jgi:hypothetical protein